jgi:cell wall-associated NlpC family hydrolase
MMPATEGAAGRAALAVQVVQTALAAMGEPYRWGGTSTEEGFDCSGLVWYAYQKHGMNIPRTSRDQGQSGIAVAPDIAMLSPGDILLFSNRGGRVTHVGLYIGSAQFIHATTSGGVRVGLLDGTGDANDRWYRDRWVGARRVLR